MLVATACGASTFAFDFARLVTRKLYSPAKELTKVEVMTMALQREKAGNYTALDTGLRHLAGVARTKNETLFFVADALPNFDYRHADGTTSRDMMNSAFLAEALRLRSSVVIAHRNPLDVLICSTNDCFIRDHSVMEPTFLNGSFSPLCFDRREAAERVYMRVHDFDLLKAKLRELASMPEAIAQSLTAHGFGIDRPIPVVRVEDLAAFQYERTPGALRALSMATWEVMLKGLGIAFMRELTRYRMDQLQHRWGVRQDELYSDRFWVPARSEDGLMEMRAAVEALVDEFGFRRTSSSKLIDWSVEQTQLVSKHGASMPRHGVIIHRAPVNTGHTLQQHTLQQHTKTSNNTASGSSKKASLPPSPQSVVNATFPAKRQP
jgi:hypothetical protein